MLGVIQLMQLRYAEAEPVFEQLLQLRPDEPAYWMNLGTARRGTGHYEESLAAYARAAALGEASVDFYYQAGLTHLARSDLQSAKALLARGLELAPQDMDMRLRYAECCYQATDHDDALAALEAWPTAVDTPARVAPALGNMLMNLGQPPRAEATVRKALAEERDNLVAKLDAGAAPERTNRIDEAAGPAEGIARQSPPERLGVDLRIARRSWRQRQSRHELALELLIQLMPDFKQAHERHRVLYPMAVTLDALGRFDDAFATLVKAHASQIARVERVSPLAAARGTPQMKVTEFHCDAQDVQQWDHATAPSSADSPVFVVAFPRSGTTLLEFTLDAHPLLQSMDEQPFIQNALEDMTAFGVKYPTELGRLSTEQLDEVRAKYWRRVAKKVQLQPGVRLVDKNPLNIVRLPVMRRLFPNSPIIMAIRHPCDIVLSCYMQNFSAPDWIMLCASLPALAAGFRKTFDYWYRLTGMLEPSVLEVRYEQLVADFPAIVRGIADYLQLPWDPAMLAPAASAHAKRFISTPRYAQVVQPINSKAVGRWENYRAHLEPVIPRAAALPAALELSGLRHPEEQVRRQDVFVAAQWRRAFVLVHPVRREHQQPPGPRRHGEIQSRQARFTAGGDVIEIPQQHQVAIGEMVDGIEVELEALIAAAVVALHDQVRSQG
jgi:tetratricopeptide (TPR) repeat protein